MATRLPFDLLFGSSGPSIYRPKMPLININEPVAHNSYLVTCNILSLPFLKK